MNTTETRARRTDWLNVGAEFNATPEQRQELRRAFDALDWQPIPCEMSFSGGEGCKEMIRQLRIPGVTHAAESHHLAPYGLLAVRGHYVNGRVDAYGVDQGDRLTMLAVDFYPVEGAAA